MEPLVAAPYPKHREAEVVLPGQLAEAARENGIAVFEARVLPENRRMIEVFRESGFSVRAMARRGLQPGDRPPGPGSHRGRPDQGRGARAGLPPDRPATGLDVRPQGAGIRAPGRHARRAEAAAYLARHTATPGA